MNGYITDAKDYTRLQLIGYIEDLNSDYRIFNTNSKFDIKAKLEINQAILELTKRINLS